MKFGVRTPSLKRRISARTSVKRRIRAKVRVPKGYGIVTNPKKALYNKVYNKTSVSADRLIKTHKLKNDKPAQNGFQHTVHTNIDNQNGKIIRSTSASLNVTSESFGELRKQINEIYEQRLVKRKELNKAKSIYLVFNTLHYVSFLMIIGFFYKSLAMKKDEAKENSDIAQNALDQEVVSLKFTDDSQLEKSWLNCQDSFTELMSSEKIWDLTYSEANNKVQQRTIADNSFKRTQVSRQGKSVEFIKSDLANLYLSNSNGPDIFIYPTFMILFKNYKQFGIYDLVDLDITLKLTSFLEEEKVPNDTEIIDHTWKKANKDGSMDKRFNGNYQIPIVKYGDLRVESKSGVEEYYMFSNYTAFTKFAESYLHHDKIIRA